MPEPIGQTMATSLTYEISISRLYRNGIERRRSASAIGWVYKFVKKQAQPFK